MKATPMQKYAMRLLMAAERIQPPSPAIWNDLQQESADLCLASFGGYYRAVEETELKRKQSSPPKNNRPSTGQTIARKNSELEIS